MLAKTCETIRPDFGKVQAYLYQSYETGRMSNNGPCVEMLSARMQSRLGIEYPKRILPVSSGHTALMAAYAVLGIKKPLMPAYTFPSTFTAATLQGITPTLVDVNGWTGCLETDEIEGIPLDSYDSVVAVCGLSTIPDLPALQRFCKRHDKKLIIDGAATFGTLGPAHWGDAFCMSLHATKSFPAGEGGLLVVDQEHYDTARSYIEFGLDSNKNLVMPGLNGKLNEYTAAISLALLDDIDPYIQRRLLNYYYLTKASSGQKYRFPETDLENTVYQFAPVFMSTPAAAKAARRALDIAGVSHLQYYKPLKDLPMSTTLYERNVCIPIHSEVTKTMLDIAIGCLITAERAAALENPSSSDQPSWDGSLASCQPKP